MRDITLGETFYHFFTTRAFATGVPTTLAATPVLSVLEENNATPITAGVSVSVDRATVAGLNQATIVATGANGYEAGKSYAIYISTGTVGGTSVVGEVVGEFTVQASAAFTRLGAPAGASESADVAAIEAQTDDIGAAGAGLTAIPWNAIWDAEVQSEVVDALNVDTYAEIGQETPAATQTIRKMIGYLYKAWRNRITQTATTYSLYADDATTVDQKATVSDDATTYDRGEVGTGP